MRSAARSPGPAACELLSRIAGTAADLVSRIDGASIAGTRIQEDIDAILAYGTSIAGLERDSLVAVPPAESADDIQVDHLSLAVAIPTPFKVVGDFETRYAARGSTFLRHFTIDRGGFEGPITVRMAVR